MTHLVRAVLLVALDVRAEAKSLKASEVARGSESAPHGAATVGETPTDIAARGQLGTALDARMLGLPQNGEFKRNEARAGQCIGA